MIKRKKFEMNLKNEIPSSMTVNCGPCSERTLNFPGLLEQRLIYRKHAALIYAILLKKIFEQERHQYILSERSD